jgi:hypothetical protein
MRSPAAPVEVDDVLLGVEELALLAMLDSSRRDSSLLVAPLSPLELDVDVVEALVKALRLPKEAPVSGSPKPDTVAASN